MLFGRKRRLKTARNNFEFIAQNIAAIYCCLRDTPFGATLSEPQLLYATGLCDTVAYLQAGQISYQDIEDSVSSALCGLLSLEFCYQQIRGILESYENDHLINFAMQIGVLICFAEMQVSPRAIIDCIVSKKKVISDAINSSMRDVTNLAIYNNVRSNVSIWASSPEFQSLVLQFTMPG